MSVESVISERLKNIKELRQHFFPDVFFQLDSTDSPLMVQLSPEPILTIRFELSENNALHLGSLALSTSDGNAESALTGATLVLSSVHPGAENLIEQRQFFTAGFAGAGFHTKAEEAPWAEVRLAKPTAVDQLTVFNRAGKWASRAWTLRISVKTAAGRWTTVFDHGARRKQFEAVLEASIGAAVPVAERDMIAAVDATAIDALAGAFGGMKKSLRARALPRATKNEVRRLVNQELLLARGVEWTTHGVTRSFRFWSKKEKVAYLAQANKLVEELKSLSPDVCLGFGSVLSIVRDRGLMPHDDDLDIIIAFPRTQAKTISAGIEAVSAFLKSRGYSANGRFVSHRHVSLGGSKAVDVFVGVYEDGESISWFPGPRGNLVRDDVFPPMSVSLFGAECQIPRNPFTYLERIYGRDWATPKPRWHHKWDRSTFQDLF